jgi:Calcineurin-like phosphoesterase
MSCHYIVRCSIGAFHFMLLLLLLLFVSSLAQQVDSSSSSSSSSPSSSFSSCYSGGTFLWLSDAHYDAFYGTDQAEVHKDGAPCSRSSNSNSNSNNSSTNDGNGGGGGATAPLYSAYGCGSSLALLTSAVKESARLSSQLLTTNTTSNSETAFADTACRVDFIIFTGDAIRHNVNPVIAPTTDDRGALVNSALTTLHDLFEEYFPGVPTVDLPALDFGNNDLLGDYELNVTSSEPCLPGDNGSPPPATNEWLVNVTATHSSLFVDGMEAAVFACGGYLNRLVRPNLRIISLNTIVWSVNHWPDTNNDTLLSTDPFGQFAWLKVQLENARAAGEKVYLTGHVPPMLQSYTGSLGEPLIKSHYVDMYFEMVTAHQDVIAAQLFGHVHSNELRAVPRGVLPDHAPPIMIQGSIAPCYTTTPFFSIVSYDRDGPTKYPTNLFTYHVDLDLYNETTSSSSPSTSSTTATNTNTSSIWKRMFTNLTSALGMAALTNAETRLLAERMVNDSRAAAAACTTDPKGSSTTPRCISTFQHYFDYWYKGLAQMDCTTLECQVQEACLVYNGFDTTIWQECVSNGFQATPSTSSSSSSNAPFLFTCCGRGGGGIVPMPLLFILLVSAVSCF